MGSDINSYVGNAGLAQGTQGGGGSYGAYVPQNTNDALDKFMTYQFYENRDKWARANLEKDNQAQQAANDLTFKLGDFLGPDNKTILDKIGEFNQFYASNPDAVKLKTDETGRIINGEDHTKWLNYRTEIDSMIARANGRRQQADLLSAQVGKFADPDKRKQGEAYYNKMISTPISDDILLYPDVAVWDPRNLTVPPIAYDQTKVYPNYIQNTTHQLADVSTGLSNYILDMADPTKEDMHNTVSGFLETYNGIIQKVKAAHPDVTNENDFRNLIAKEDGGDAVIQLYDNMNSYLDFYNSPSVTDYTKKDPVAKVTLMDGLTNKEMGLLLITNKLSNDSKIQNVHTGDALQKLNIDRDYEAAMARVANEREQLAQSADAAGLKGNNALANDKANLFMDVLGTPLKGTVKPNQLGYPVAVDQIMENIFQKALPQPVTTKVPNDPADPEGGGYTTTTSKNYPISGVVVTPDASNDPNKSTITVEYKDPRNNKFFRETFSPQRFWNLANNLYGTDNAEKVSKASSAYLKKEYSLDQPDFIKMANNYKLSAGQDEPQPFDASAPTFVIKGNEYQRDAVMQSYTKNKQKGESLEQFINRLNGK